MESLGPGRKSRSQLADPVDLANTSENPHHGGLYTSILEGAELIDTRNDNIKLDRLQRHGRESITRMEAKVNNTTGEIRERAIARLHRFKQTLDQEIRNIRGRIYRREKAGLSRSERPKFKSRGRDEK